MGLIYVILFWLAVLLLLLFPLVVSLIGKWENRGLRFKRTLLGTVLFVLIALVLNLAASSILGTDIGIGDGFRVRIKNGYSLEFADILTNGCVYKDAECIISGVDGISVRKDSLYLLVDDEYVLLDMATGEVMRNISKPAFGIQDATSYYYARYWATGGLGLILSVLVAAIISVYMTRKLIRR